jgi:tight adherence protein B
MDTFALITSLTIMASIIAGMVALYQATASPRDNLQRRLGSLLTDSGFEASALDYQALRPKRTGRVPLVGRLIEGRDWTEDMALRLEQADLKLTVSEFVALRILMAFVLGTLPVLFLGQGPIGILGLAVGSIAGYELPSLYVSFSRGRRVTKLTVQLIEALSLISNSLKAGFGLMQSLELASRELKHPLSTEIRRTLYDINVGSTTEDALQNFAKRSGSEDLDIVLTAMLIQQSTGGNLAEILDNVGHTMRERIRIRGEIKTLTTQQLLTGFIVGGLPFAMIFLFSLINPEYMMPLFTETAGNLMLIGAGFLELFGILVIKKILAIEV